MENLDNIAKNSLEALSKNNLTEQAKKKLRRELFETVLMYEYLFNRYIQEI